MKTNLPPAFTDRLAELVSMLRNRHVPQDSELRWRKPLVLTAIDKLCNDGVSPAEIGIALFRAADDLTMRSPVVATGPGPVWEDTRKGESRIQTMCPEHPGVPYTRCECQTRRVGTPKPANFAQLAAQARADAAADNPTRTEIAHRQATAWAAQRTHTA